MNDFSAARLADLRAELARRELDGFLVPLADEHQGEYIPPCAMRLAWLTGFTGSAGMAVVLREQAALFVDGRYTLQAGQEVDTHLFSLHHLLDEPPHKWLAGILSTGQQIGFDPWLHTPNGIEALRKSCEKAGAALVACSDNPIDVLWNNRPAPPRGSVVPHPLDFAGRSAADKRDEIAGLLKSDNIDAVVF